MGRYREGLDGHEGWISACIDFEGTPLDRDAPRGTPLDWVRTECECGWKGPVVPAPDRAEWAHYSVWLRGDLDDNEHDRLMSAWDVHADYEHARVRT